MRALVLLPLLALGHCAPTATAHAHRRPAVVAVSEHYSNAGGRTTVSPPQRLDLIMDDGGSRAAIAARCATYGSTTLVWPHGGGLAICENVDY